jgi:hypothetical protein
MGHIACTEPQCLYKAVLYLTFDSYIWAAQLIEEFFILVSPLAAGSGASGSPSIFSVVSSLCTKYFAGPEDCVVGVDGVWKKGLRDTRTAGVETLLGHFLNNFWTWDSLSQLLK